MPRFAARTLVTMVIGAAVAVSQAGVAAAGGPGVWTKFGVTNSGGNQAGMLRTADGTLHLVWLKQNSDKTFTYITTTFSLAGKLGGAGTALAGWTSLEGDPRLVRDGPGIRLVLLGGRTTNAGDFFSRGAVYTETSANGGKSWALVHGSMAQHTVLNLGLAAATDAAGTPFAAFGLNSTLYFHKGVDPSAPAASADGSVTGQTGSGLENPALARDKAGAIWLAWFQLFGSREGYYVARVLPSKAAPVKAPGSGSGTSADNEPRQQVALAARPGGGVYLAYCTATATKQCAHIDLWKVGSAHPMVVPGSGTGSAGRVALAVGPGGRLTVAWFDFGQNKIHVVRTRVREELAGQPRPGVSFLGSLLMPEDEVLLCLFCGPEADVRAVSERAGLPFERIIGCLRLGCDIRQDRAVITLTSKSTITMKCDDFGSGANAHAVVLTAIG